MSRFLLICLIVLSLGLHVHGGVASYSERGKVDFDKVMPLLNPYGTWAKIDGKWAYTPLNHEAPYTNGRWLYTEYGWYWKGNQPYSWLTEHYGYWKRSEDKVWSWYPGTNWLAEIVEFRMTDTHIGWRSGEVDDQGQFVESPEERYSKKEEWVVVTKAQFAGPIKPGMAMDATEADQFLLDATDCMHTYLTYRPIVSPGPHPADFLALNKDGGMFSPYQRQEVAPLPSVPSTPSSPVAEGTNAAPATTRPMTGTNAIAFAGTGDDADNDIDKRQVKYWVTMSLPTYWTPRPEDAKPEEIYIYRPDFYQDEDGIARRITLWYNPNTKTSLKDIFAQTAASQRKAQDSPDAAATPAQPAIPASSAHAHDPFSSPLDASYHSTSRSNGSASSSSASTNGPAPSGLANPSK